MGGDSNKTSDLPLIPSDSQEYFKIIFPYEAQWQHRFLSKILVFWFLQILNWESSLTNLRTMGIQQIKNGALRRVIIVS